MRPPGTIREARAEQLAQLAADHGGRLALDHGGWMLLREHGLSRAQGGRAADDLVAAGRARLDVDDGLLSIVLLERPWAP